MPRRTVKAPAQLPPTCERCRCTERSACPGGCAWVPTFLAGGRYVCTSCVGPAERTATPALRHQPVLKIHGYLNSKEVAKHMKGRRQPSLHELLRLFKGEYGDRSMDVTVEIQLRVED